MQKIRNFFIYILSFFLIVSVFLPIGASFAWKDKYDYTDFTDKINISSNSTIFDKVLSFSTPRTTFSLVFPHFLPQSEEDIKVDWIIDGRTYTRHLDLDDKQDGSREVISTFPFVTDVRSSIRLRISSLHDVLPEDIKIITSRQDSRGKSLVFIPGGQMLWASGPTHIVSRSDWGADESLRYMSLESQARRTNEWIARGKTPLLIEETEKERARRIRGNTEFNTITSLDSDAVSIVSFIRHEGSHKLTWPIQTSKKIGRIVIHHTAESLAQDADDMTLLRAIYLYHTRTKGWGDIGYNFVVGQRGIIYEGRAGGDYVQGAHVYGNNTGTVGISLIGNYQTLHLNKDQKAGMIEAIVYVAKKYGINVTEDAAGAKSCGSNEDCVWKKVITPRLIGHRDLGSTSCPGENLYELLSELRSIVVGKVGNIEPIYNHAPEKKDIIAPEDMVSYVLKNQNTPPIPIISPPVSPKSSGGKPIKIKLSYPNGESISLSNASLKNPLIRLDNKKIPFLKNALLMVKAYSDDKLIVESGGKIYTGAILSFAADLVRIPSWSRIPSWDTTGKYNDNVFRKRIIIRNISGKLLVVNELPMEDYLKGLAEVTDRDPLEKIKTIQVAARSYGYFYIDRKNRKFSTDFYDLDDDPEHSQEYKGYTFESRYPMIVKMVNLTKGEIIMYKNSPIKPWYFSTSDGHTRSYYEYCQSNGGKSCEDIPYLQSVDDPGASGKVRSGHGVGISGVGATYFALQGWDYKKIIGYYLSGAEVRKR